MDKFLNKNEVKVIGTLVESDLEIKESKAGQDYIQGKIKVKTVLDGKEQIFEFRLFSFKYKKDSTDVNAFFKTYMGLENKVGRRIKVVGSIEENRFFQERNGQIVSFNLNNGRFIYDANDSEDDQATFDFAGYVDKPVHERLDKDDNLLYYEIVLGQANYNGTEPIFVKFQIDPSDRRAVSYMEKNYEKGTTVSVNGDLTVEVEEVLKEEEVAFGSPNVHKYVNVFRAYVIKSGSEPIYGKNEYLAADIRQFAAAYEDKGIEIQNSAKERSSMTSSTPAKKTNSTSLI